jgi:hypothetical protein
MTDARQPPMSPPRARTSLTPLTHGQENLGLYWGDFHNHCAVGLFHFSKGSLERAIENAQSHLDFFAFTGHSQWHDMPGTMANNSHLKWIEGFQHHTDHWPGTKELIQQANQPGEFVAFLGYEWHSAKYGDRCLIFKDDEGELRIMADLPEVEAYAREVGAILYPHHIGYKHGLPGRGLNWKHFNPDLSPIIEIQSEHGCSERDRGPYPYITHSNGPRMTSSTYQYGLSLGLHCGVAGGSDSHLGFPGAYREGIIGVFAAGLTRDDILSGTWKRRTIASSGERITIDFRLNDGFIGDIMPATHNRHIRGSVSGWDEIDRIEVIKNNAVVHRAYPRPGQRTIDDQPRRFLLRFEYGWGPRPAFGNPGVSDWDVHIGFEGADIVSWEPCFQAAPFDEERRHQIEVTSQDAALTSYTSRVGALLEVPTNAIVFEILGRASDTVTFQITKPNQRTFTYRLGDLFKSSEAEFLGEYLSESILVHRLVPEPDYHVDFEFEDQGSTSKEDYYYIRTLQTNDQLAWSSPIWVQA